MIKKTIQNHMKKEKKRIKKLTKKTHEHFIFMAEVLRHWNGFELLENYAAAKTGAPLDIEDIPCWILNAFDELPKILVSSNNIRLMENPCNSSNKGSVDPF